MQNLSPFLVRFMITQFLHKSEDNVSFVSKVTKLTAACFHYGLWAYRLLHDLRRKCMPESFEEDLNRLLRDLFSVPEQITKDIWTIV